MMMTNNMATTNGIEQDIPPEVTKRTNDDADYDDDENYDDDEKQ